jgi:hypothetical protein
MKKIRTLTNTITRSLATLALILTTSSAAITWAQTQTPAIVLVSGYGAIGGRDAATQFTLDGTNFQEAFIVEPDPLYALFPGTKYISCSANKMGFPFTTVHYRTMFQLPEGYSGQQLNIFLHADNAARVFLNGTIIGEQQQVEDPINYQDPAQAFSTSYPFLFHQGTNVLDFYVTNFNDSTAFAYLAEIFFTSPLQVTIDIKPGAYPNPINLGSNGDVPVAILSTPSFDARNVDPTSLSLAGAFVSLKGNGTPMASVQDVNNDGLLDLVVHISTQALQLSDTDTQAVLEGQTLDGRAIKGADTIRIVP